MAPSPQIPPVTRPEPLPQTQPTAPQEVWILLTTQQQRKTFQTLVMICQQIILQSSLEVQLKDLSGVFYTLIACD